MPPLVEVKLILHNSAICGVVQGVRRYGVSLSLAELLRLHHHLVLSTGKYKQADNTTHNKVVDIVEVLRRARARVISNELVILTDRAKCSCGLATAPCTD
jgi:protein tyrosine phosphatase